uniref:Secreted protein n=1 Tax=Cacopsylla melanoneura TaxID=428564 RepID=A0A8D8RGP9_9HEMI
MMKDNLVHISVFLLQCSISMSSLLQHGVLHYYVLKSWKPTLSSKVQIWSPWSSYDERQSCTYFSIATAMFNFYVFTSSAWYPALLCSEKTLLVCAQKHGKSNLQYRA